MKTCLAFAGGKKKRTATSVACCPRRHNSIHSPICWSCRLTAGNITRFALGWSHSLATKPIPQPMPHHLPPWSILQAITVFIGRNLSMAKCFRGYHARHSPSGLRTMASKSWLPCTAQNMPYLKIQRCKNNSYSGERLLCTTNTNLNMYPMLCRSSILLSLSNPFSNSPEESDTYQSALTVRAPLFWAAHQ
jgi:hypothetical protein